MKDRWLKLLDIATDVEDADRVATIIPDYTDPDTVTLTWPGGESSVLHWHDGDWRFSEGRPPYDAATATGMYDRDF